MATLGLREAAKAAGVSRQTIYRYAASGRLSVTQRQDGTQGVDTSELMRVFGPLRDPATVPEKASVTPQDSPDSRLLQAIQGELEATKQALRMAQAALDQAQEREGRLLGLLEQQTRLLEHRPEPRRTTASKPTAKVDKKARKGDKKAKKSKGGRK